MEQLKNDLLTIVRLAEVEIANGQIEIVDRGVPHKPSHLPKGKIEIYAFIDNDEFLKVGKAGSKSNARFSSQHYIPKSSLSNLAKSILNDPDKARFNLTEDVVGDWIKENMRRVDIFIDESLGMFVANLLEAFMHLKFKPKYEGFHSQR